MRIGANPEKSRLSSDCSPSKKPGNALGICILAGMSLDICISVTTGNFLLKPAHQLSHHLPEHVAA